jgi:hypothetical protein
MAHRSDIVPPPPLAQSAWGLSHPRAAREPHPRAAREPHPLNRIRIGLAAEGRSEAQIVAAEQEWQAKEKQRLTEHHRALRAARKRARDRVEKRSKAKVNRARHKRLKTPLTPHQASSDREHSSEENTPSPPAAGRAAPGRGKKRKASVKKEVSSGLSLTARRLGPLAHSRGGEKKRAKRAASPSDEGAASALDDQPVITQSYPPKAWRPPADYVAPAPTAADVGFENSIKNQRQKFVTERRRSRGL